jgi:non-heme chloroperoxidase
MKKLLIILLIIFGIFIVTNGILISFPPPESIPMLDAVAAPIRKIDFSRLPAVEYYSARDGSKLAYRKYLTQNAKQVVVLVHGSGGSSRGAHPLAEYLQKQGMSVYAPDIRGHGYSGRRGDIDYIGQLENDMEDFVNGVVKQHDALLAGFSSGGGFVLRLAAGPKQVLFARYLLLSPFIAYNSPTVKPNSGGWVSASTKRIMGILLLGPAGKILFGHLPVITFAIDPERAQYQTAHYSFNLLMNYSPHFNYKSDISSVKRPLTVIAGEKDELFNAYAFGPLFTESKPGTKVIIVPDTGHITLTTTIPGMTAIAKAVRQE